VTTGPDTPVLAELPAFWPAGEPLSPGALPPATARVIARSAFGAAIATDLAAGPEPLLAGLGPGTWAVEARAADGSLLAEELVVVAGHQGERAVPGFATSFGPDGVAPAADWLRALRCTVVQAYDWMASYSRPLPAAASWRDPLGRPVELAALRELTSRLAAAGAVVQAYAPVYAADPGFGAAHPEHRLYRGDGEPQHLGDLLQIMNPADEWWQEHWTAEHRAALAAAGFGGLHLDTYGYPRAATDRAGVPVALDQSYGAFLGAVAAAFPAAIVSFNQVNGVPSGVALKSPRRFRYVEVWPPNNAWRHLEGLLARAAGAGEEPVVLALYPPVWPAPEAGGGETGGETGGEADGGETGGGETGGGETGGEAGARAAALRTVVLTEATVTVLGASLLVWGDDRGALRHPYYPDHERLTEPEAATALRWHRFALRHRDLFARAGEPDRTDTSWYDIGDENGGVAVTGGPPPSPEPLGGTIFTRVVRGDDLVAVSLLDLTGSRHGRWDEPTQRATAAQVTVDILVDQPDGWTAAVATLDRHGGRFHPVSTSLAGHREGIALRLLVPLGDGWAVVRLRRGRRRSSP
jgi:dextranase